MMGYWILKACRRYDTVRSDLLMERAGLCSKAAWSAIEEIEISLNLFKKIFLSKLLTFVITFYDHELSSIIVFCCHDFYLLQQIVFWYFNIPNYFLHISATVHFSKAVLYSKQMGWSCSVQQYTNNIFLTFILL